MENIRTDITTKIAMEFLDKIQQEDLSDEEIFFILAKLLRLMTAGIEKIEGKDAADIHFLQFIKMYDLNGYVVNNLI